MVVQFVIFEDNQVTQQWMKDTAALLPDHTSITWLFVESYNDLHANLLRHWAQAIVFGYVTKFTLPVWNYTVWNYPSVDFVLMGTDVPTGHFKHCKNVEWIDNPEEIVLCIPTKQDCGNGTIPKRGRKSSGNR